MAGDRGGEQFDLFGSGSAVMSTEVDSSVGERAALDVVLAATAVTATEPDKPVPLPKRPAIQDAGAELVYNRRNRIRAALKWDDVEDLNATLKVKEVVKANVWPKPNYAKLIEDGMSPVVAHLVKQAYDSVAANVVTGRETADDAMLRRYMDGVQRVESGVMAWAADKANVEAWLSEQGSYRVMGAERAKTLLQTVYPDGWDSVRPEIRVCGGNKLLHGLQLGYNEVQSASKAIRKGWPAKRASWQIQGYSVVSDLVVEVNPLGRGNSTFMLTVNSRPVRSYPSELEAHAGKVSIKPFALFGKRGFVASFDSEEEAIAGARERTQKAKLKGLSEQGERVEAVERVGVVRRFEGEDITSERLMTEFGLKGVNFGNWMKTPAARVEAQLHLNHAFDAFHDLAEILGIPPKAISLNGMLGLAIGAQGSGPFAAAHFVPGVNEINLTRLSGAGAVAHEWAHALDHYFAVQAGLASSGEPFLTSHVGTKSSGIKTVAASASETDPVAFRPGIRPELVAAFEVVVDAMNNRLETWEDVELAEQNFGKKIQENLNGWLAAIRVGYSGLDDKFVSFESRIKKGDVGEGRISIGRGSYLSPALFELRELFKAKHGRVYPVHNFNGLQACVTAARHHKGKVQANEFRRPRKVLSSYAQAAAKLDGQKGGKPYWGTNLEKFARAFDAFVSDSLEAKQAKNGYLSHTARAGETVPEGEERRKINGALKELVGAVEVRQSERGPVLFSNGIEGLPKAMPLAEIQAEVLRLRKQWKSMPSVTVVQSPKDLPFKAAYNVDGAYCAGRVYVVADNISDVKQLQKVMAHECVLHHGLEEMLGPYGFAKLHHGIQQLKSEGDPVVMSLAANILSRYGHLPPEIETREIVARAGEQCLDELGNLKIGFGWMKSVFAGITGWLRDHGIAVPFTNLELQGIMHDAGEWVKQDGPGRAPVYPNTNTNGLVLNSFGGVRAMTAPLDTLRVAREMVLMGDSDRNIWDQTGWTFAFADGEPRFEISDDHANVVVEYRTVNEVWRDMSEVDSTVTNVGEFIVKYPDHSLTTEVNNPTFGRPAYLGMKSMTPDTAREIEAYLQHRDLYAAYPQLASLRASKLLDADGVRSDGVAAFVPSDNRIDFSKLKNPDEFMQASLHEFQHAIQRIEGFALGGSPEDFGVLDVTGTELEKISAKVQELFDQNPAFFLDVVKTNQLTAAIIDRHGSLLEGLDDELAQDLQQAIDRRNDHPEYLKLFRLKNQEGVLKRSRVLLSPTDQYERLAGEAESKLTQVRSDMTPDERRAVYPLDNMDVPVNAQAVRFDARIETSTPVSDGFHVGRVLDVVNGAVLQRSGPSGSVVRHAASDLVGCVVAIGSVIEVTYKGGVGSVKEVGQSGGLGER